MMYRRRGRETAGGRPEDDDIGVEACILFSALSALAFIWIGLDISGTAYYEFMKLHSIGFSRYMSTEK